MTHVTLFCRWKSLESIGSLGWSGSAVLGGYLADKYDYSVTFLITVLFQFLGSVIQFSLVNVVPKEKKTLVESPSITEEKLTDLLLG